MVSLSLPRVFIEGLKSDREHGRAWPQLTMQTRERTRGRSLDRRF
jgi:hypothetical protein